MSSDPSTDTDSTDSDGLVAFGTLLLVIALLGVLSNGPRSRAVRGRGRESTPPPESTAASASGAGEPPRA